MTLIWNWKDVFGTAWSIKLGAFSALFGSFQQAMSYIPAGLVGLTPETWTIITAIFGGLSILFAAAVVPARLLDQKISPTGAPK